MAVEYHTYPVLITIAKYRKRYQGVKCVALELTYTEEFSKYMEPNCKICPSYGMCKAFKSKLSRRSKLL